MILQRSNILTKGQTYTFTHESGETFQDSESWVRDQLSNYLAEYGEVRSVERGFFSGHYAVTVIPSVNISLADWIAWFEYAYQQMGWEDNQFVQAEGGSVSTQPGGAKQAIVETAAGVAGTIGGAAGAGIGALLRPLAPYIILIAGAWLAYEYTKHQRR